jgi:hypothetical protein
VSQAVPQVDRLDGATRRAQPVHFDGDHRE